jgi:hypothetical protein
MSMEWKHPSFLCVLFLHCFLILYDKIFRSNGKIDSLSDSDDFGEEVIYSHESPEMEEFIRDFDWDLNRFVEDRSPFTRKETLTYQLKNQFRFRVGTEIVFDLK